MSITSGAVNLPNSAGKVGAFNTVKVFGVSSTSAAITNTMTSDGSISTIFQGANGPNVINNLTATGGTSEVIGGSGTNDLTASGGTVTLIGGTGPNTFYLEGAGNYTVDGSGPVTGPAAPATPGVDASEQTPALSVARSAIAATTVGTEAIFAGGLDENGLVSNVVDIYDDSTGVWSTASLPQACQGMTAVSVGNYAIFAGGIGSNGSPSNEVDIYDATTGIISAIQPSGSTQLLDGMTVATVGSQVLFAGGIGSNGEPSAEVDIYDTRTGNWSSASLSQPRYGMAVATVGNQVVFAGGVYVSSVGLVGSSDVDIYNATTGTIASAQQGLSQPRSGLSATTVGNEVLFAGGFNSDGPSNDVDIYNAETRSTTPAPEGLSQARGYCTAITVGTKAIFAGGWTGSSLGTPVNGPSQNQNSLMSNVVDIYDASAPPNQQWSTTTLSQAGYVQALTVGYQVLFAGGASTSGPGYTDVVDIYHANAPANNQWSTAFLSQARLAAATTVGTKVIFAGGATDSVASNAVNGVSNAVDIYDSTSGQWSPSTGQWYPASYQLNESLNLPQTQWDMAATTVDNLALFAGGWTSSGPSEEVDIYNATTNTIVPNPGALSQARADMAVTTVDDLAMFAGGYNSDNEASNVVDIYDALTGDWLKPLSLPQSESDSNMAATTVGNLALFAGGDSDMVGPNRFNGYVDIYDAKQGGWLQPATLPHARADMAATTVGNLAFCAGGWNSSGGVSGEVDIYDPSAPVGDQWVITALSQPRQELVATTVGTKAIFAGGFGSNGLPSTTALG